jgi:RimJ/RimL family protein N-acetyltransferase
LIDNLNWLYVGSILRFEGRIDNVIKSLGHFNERFSLHEATDEDWELLPDFLKKNQPINRFIKDPHIGRSLALEQKLKILQSYRERCNSASIYCRNGEIVGFQLSYVAEPNVVVLYEIVIAQNYQNGFLALSLIGAGLKNLVQKIPNLDYVRTAIYTNNIKSINLFTRIGLSPLPKKQNYYHLWPKI